MTLDIKNWKQRFIEDFFHENDMTDFPKPQTIGEWKTDDVNKVLDWIDQLLKQSLEEGRHKPFYWKEDRFMCCKDCGNILNPKNIYKTCPGKTTIGLRASSLLGEAK